MADFSLTTLFVVPVGQDSIPSSGSTQDLPQGTVGIFKSDYTTATAGNISASPYFYIAQGRENTYLQGSKRSDKIGVSATTLTGNAQSILPKNANVTEWYKVTGCPTAANQILDISNFTVKCGEDITLTLRAHSSYIDTLYFNGFTRSVTVTAPCCDCNGDPCTTVDEGDLIDQLIAKLNAKTPSNASENISLSTFYTFEKIGGTTLRITGKPLTKYGLNCDVAAFPFEYDRMWFRAFIYAGPATTADFITADSCASVASTAIIQRSSYPTGTSAEIAQLEKNFHSYQTGIQKHLFRMSGYNQTFETYVADGVSYNTFYIKFNEYNKGAYNWGDYVPEDSTVIIAIPQTGGDLTSDFQTILEAALGTVTSDNECITTTTTTSSAPTTTTTTTPQIIP